MPPIPDDAVVISDYMLMADHVIVGGAGNQLISKGVRRVDASRDIFYDNNATINFHHATDLASCGGTRIDMNGSHSSTKAELPAFCTNQINYGYNVAARYQTYAIDSGSGYSNVTPTAKTGSAEASFYNNTGNAHALGLAKHKVHGTFQTSTGYVEAIDVVTPIHTSSHYQTFETPFLHELVGGDRNMEQTNLVVTPDGKTWDEVTRDVSYIGNVKLVVSAGAAQDFANGIASVAIPNTYRGVYAGRDCFNKDIAIAYDRWIILKDGQYTIHFNTLRSATGNAEGSQLKVNGVSIMVFYSNVTNYRSAGHLHTSRYFKRGDYIQIFGSFWNGHHGGLSVISEGK
jgi:hypothetical protein